MTKTNEATAAAMTPDQNWVIQLIALRNRLVDYSGPKGACFEMVWPNGGTKPVKTALVRQMVRKGLLVKSGWEMRPTALAAELFEVKTPTGKLVRPGLPAELVAFA